MLLFFLVPLLAYEAEGSFHLNFTCDNEGFDYGDNADLCLGVPLSCHLSFNVSLCDTFSLSSENVSLRLEFAGQVYSPTFALRRESFGRVGLAVNFRPSRSASSVMVQVTSVQDTCSFLASEVFSLTSNCTYPMEIQYGPHPESLAAGTVFQYDLLYRQIVALRNVTIAVRRHPALSLTLINVTEASSRPCLLNQSDLESQLRSGGLEDPNDNNRELRSTYEAEPQLSAAEEVVCLDLLTNQTARVTLEVKVQQHLLPQSLLFLDMSTTYRVPAVGGPFASISLHSLSFTTPLGPNLHSSWLSVPNYASSDIASNSFTPHLNEPFIFTTSISFPCVASSVNISIGIPNFFSVNSTAVFFLNVTDVVLNGRVGSFLLYSYGSTTPLSISNSPQSSILNNDNGTEMVNAVFGTIQRTVPCMRRRELQLDLMGVNAYELPSEHITLHDNITIEMNYTAESTGSDGELQTMVVTEAEIYPVNVTRPDISLPISSHLHDAKDELVMMFGVLHNDTSGVTAWNLSYSFHVDERLEVAENITFCHYIDGNSPNCTDLPFINHTINGFFEE